MIVCLAVLTSCQKDVPETSNNPFFKLLVAIKENDKLVTEFRYDSLKRLVLLNNYRSDTVINSESYQYDLENRLIKRIYPGFMETYQYSGSGKLQSTTLDYPATSKEWKTEYQYSGKKISKGITYFNGDKRGYIDFKYDSRGNTVERSEYAIAEGQEDFLDEQFKMTYDDKVNPLQNPSIYPADFVQNNNPVYFYHYLSVMSSPPKEYHSTYEYDYQGYPTREIRDLKSYSWHYEYRVNLDNLYFEHQMKGWELYSWQIGNGWYYSFLMGTNRIKTYEEVINNPIIAYGTDSLKLMLDRFPEHEEIFWIGEEWLEAAWPGDHGNLKLPDQETIDEIKAYCLKKDLVLSVGW